MAVVFSITTKGKNLMYDVIKDKITHVYVTKSAPSGSFVELANMATLSTDGAVTKIEIDYPSGTQVGSLKSLNTIGNDPLLFGVKNGNALYGIYLGKYDDFGSGVVGFQVEGSYIPNISDKGYDWFYHVRYIETNVTSVT